MLSFLRQRAATLIDQQPPESREQSRQHLLRITDSRRIGRFACACCRNVWPLLVSPESRAAVEITERYLAGEASDAELNAVQSAAVTTALSYRVGSRRSETTRAQREAARATAYLTRLEAEAAIEASAAAISWGLLVQSYHEEKSSQAALARDVFGNPFRPVAFVPAWRTETAVAIARNAYESRDFSTMPILADALEEAGCHNADVLDHCRDKTITHVRGCWVLDLVLERD